MKKLYTLFLLLTSLSFSSNATVHPVYHGGYYDQEWVTCDLGDTIVMYAADPAWYEASVWPAGTTFGGNTITNYGDSVTCYVIQGNETSLGLNMVISTGPLNPPINTPWIINLTINSPCLVTIPDVNFKAYLVGNTAINTNGDSEIQCAEASAYSGSINLYNSGTTITNLTGIETFVNLTELQVYSPNLINIDVSNNTALTFLHLENTGLTNVDVSNNTALTILNIHNGNQLQSVTFGNNSNLAQLWVHNNQLTSLNIGNLTSLSQLLCFNNQLTVLDISANTNLGQLDCHSNLLTNITFNNTLWNLDCNDNLLTHLNLSTANILVLFCQDNQLDYLNVANGNNTNLSNFDATNNPDLTCIKVDNAAYSTANWTNIDAIASFSVDCTTGIIENNETLVSTFPNPVASFLNIKSTKPTSAIITSPNGTRLSTLVLNGETQVDVSSYAPGVYFIRTAEGQTVKFIKE